MSVPPTDQRELTLAVVGINFPNEDRARTNRRFEVELCAPGDPVELRREPKNEHDRFAVAVFGERGIQLGYLNAERAPWIGAKIAAGEEWHAVFQGLGQSAALIRVRFGGGMPTLPAQREPPADRDEAYQPDPDVMGWGA